MRPYVLNLFSCLILFSCNNREVKLNWENSDSKWISVNELNEFTTVPSLDKVLTRLF